VKVAVVNSRTSLVVGDRLVDAERASGGAVPADPAAMFAAWPALLAAAARLEREGAPSDAPALDHGALERPVPVPSQAFGIGLNYADHAGESAMALPDRPLVFPKFSSSIAGPNEPVATRSDALDWEAELVVVIGTDCYEVDAADALPVIAGYTVGQDLSDRVVQFEGGANPQFGLGKSAPGFGPVGPWVVSADELGAAGRLDIRCDVDGVTKQASNTRHLIFDVPALVEYLSYRVRLHAGDLIFTGTPAGVGFSRTPAEWLRPGSRIDTTISGIGTLVTRVTGR
jgi:2-keto-4-pentenoate hydratase/2-oxohepta-3-ene-1,7-dioic acid hydratase in catechol pathway